MTDLDLFVKAFKQESEKRGKAHSYTSDLLCINAAFTDEDLKAIFKECFQNLWLPIKEAPRDKPFLVFDRQQQESAVAKLFVPLLSAPYISINDAYGFSEDGQIYDATHFQDLPEPPR